MVHNLRAGTLERGARFQSLCVHERQQETAYSYECYSEGLPGRSAVADGGGGDAAGASLVYHSLLGGGPKRAKCTWREKHLARLAEERA